MPTPVSISKYSDNLWQKSNILVNYCSNGLGKEEAIPGGNNSMIISATLSLVYVKKLAPATRTNIMLK